MKLTSLDISPAAKIDKKFTCDGRGISPALAWSDFPATTKSFALVMSDPDAPGGTYLHWLVCNIPVDKNFLSQNELLAPPAIALANSSGETSYVPPCPPSGAHRYVFDLYALDVENLENVSPKNFFGEIKAHSLNSAKLTANYSRE